MQIGDGSNLIQSKYVRNQNISNNIAFTGFSKKETPCMFVFDLDGTFANGSGKDISQVLNLTKDRNATLIYATGRSKESVEKLQAEFAQKGVKFPTPRFLVTNSGAEVYENIDGHLIEDTNYPKIIKARTNFDSAKIGELMKNSFGEKLTCVKEDDLTIHYKVNNEGENLKELEEKVVKVLDENKIKSGCLAAKLDPKTTMLFLAPAGKEDGIEYLRKQQNVSKNEILMAGDEVNDMGMAGYAHKFGAKFICLGNASERLKTLSENFQKDCNSIYMATNEGVKGILEGIKHFIVSCQK